MVMIRLIAARLESTGRQRASRCVSLADCSFTVDAWLHVSYETGRQRGDYLSTWPHGQRHTIDGGEHAMEGGASMQQMMPRRLKQQRIASRREARHSLFPCRIETPSLCYPTSPLRRLWPRWLAGDQPRVQYTNHQRADSPLKLGNTARPSPLAALLSKGSLCFSLRALRTTFPYHKNIHCINTSQWVASERNPRNAPCAWPTPLRVAQRYHQPSSPPPRSVFAI